MKTISKITLGLATAALLFVGCGESTAPAKNEVVKPTISEESLGLRKKTLFSEDAKVAPRKTSYATNYAGSGVKIKRAFQDAPPMIPHDTTGMLPIKIGNNQCIGCHMPDVAAGVGATPIPVSHMTNFRPKSHAIGGENTSSEKLANISIKKTNKLVGARFNCSQCHAPQSDTPLAVENNFKPEYTSKNGANRSSWNGSKFMDGINTYESSK
jgi:cytochrome c-type protein NapB